MSASTYSYIAFIVAMALDILTLITIINMDANPEYKVSWLTVVLALPLAGALLFAIFYKRRLSKKEARLLRGSLRELSAYRNHDVSELLASEDVRASGEAMAIIRDEPCGSVYRGTSSEFFSSGEDYFEAMIRDLREARSFVFLEYYIIGQGSLWDEIHGILKQKAKAGLDVRLLYDDIGCMSTLPSHYELHLRSEGIKCHRFNRVNPRVTMVHNNRDHRKICIVDGRVCYTGGVNIADEYVNRVMRFGYWKDGGIRLCGHAVEGFMKLFLSLWDFTARTVSDYERLLSSVTEAEEPDGGYYLPFGTGPHPIYKSSVGKRAFLNIINRAERYVYITTPYLVVDYDLTEAICNAAARGVDVRIVTPGIADKKIIKIMTKSSYPTLMRAGVKIFEYAPGFIHEKTLVADDKYAVIGTINLDYRSLMHNFECAVWIYSSPTVVAARDAFLTTLEDCAKMNGRFARLTFFEWLVRCGVKIFAPLL